MIVDRLRKQRDRIRFRRRYGFPPPPDWSDQSGYEPLMDAILSRGVLKVPGDFVEIGALLRGAGATS